MPTPSDQQQAGLSPFSLSVGLIHPGHQKTCFFFWGSGILVTTVLTQAMGSQRPGLHVWVSISDGRHPSRHILTYCCGASLGEGPWELHLVSLTGPCAPPALDSACCALSGVSLICVRLQAASPQEVTSPGLAVRTWAQLSQRSGICWNHPDCEIW